MSAWERFKESIGLGTKSDTDKAVSQAVNDGGTRTYTAGITDDLTMGLSTIGLGREAQAEKLSEMGYAPGAIEDFQYRTEQTKQRNLSMMSSGSDDDDRPTPVVETAPTTTTETTTTPDIVAEVPETPSMVRTSRPAPPPKPDPVYKGRRVAPPAGATEAEAMEAGSRGRKATIGTTPVGLLREPETRGRRSLMGLIR